jgi:type IV pilus assembly protein PilC
MIPNKSSSVSGRQSLGFSLPPSRHGEQNRPAKVPFWQKGPDAVSRCDLFNRLAILLRAGVTLPASLEMLSDSRSAQLQQIINGLREKLEQGLSISQSMEQISAGFSAFDIRMLRVGEESGKLEDSFDSLAAHYRMQIEIRKKLIQAGTYPLVILMVACGVMLFMFLKVVPMFASVFISMDEPLPPVSRWVLGISDFFRESAFLLPILLILPLSAIAAWKGSPAFVRFFRDLIPALPLAGPVVRRFIFSRCFGTLATALNAGLSLEKGISLAAETANWPSLQTELKEVRKAVIEGRWFYQAIQERALFPKDLGLLLRVGESSGKLGTILTGFANREKQEAENRLSILLQLLEPALILLVAGLVGLILIAMYLPMFQLSQSFSP